VSVDESAAPRLTEDAARRVRSLADVPLLVESVEVEGGASPATRQALQSYGAFRREDLRAAAVPLPTAELDWPQVVQLRRRASEEIAGESEHQLRTTGTPITGDDRLLLGRSVIRRVVADHVRTLHREGAALWSPDQEQAYVAAVEAAVFGYGRLQPLLELPDVENVEIHGWDSVVVQLSDGRRRVMPPVADSDAELVEAIRFLGQNAEPSRPFDDVHPTMTLALGERFRLHAIGFGLSYRPSVVIRQHTMTSVSLLDLVDGGLMPLEVAELLDAAVLARKSVVISGDQGAGKTTLLRALIDAIPAGERFGTLETDYELMTHLQPGRQNILALQARVGHGEAAAGRAVGEFSVADLMPEALRQNLSRLVVGEVRGSEAASMFEAMQAGTGTLSTTHSHSASSTIDRLASRVAQGGVLSVEEAYRQIAHNIHLLVHVRLVDDSWRGGHRRRFVSEVRQVVGAVENGRPVTHLTYGAERTPGQPAGFFPDADFASELAPFRRELRSRSASGGPDVP
jgi:pilus assembly protein CpaF